MENENPTSTTDSNEHLYAIISHLTPLTAYVVPGIGWILGPLLWWVLMKDKSPAVEEHGKEVLNYAISYTIYTIAASLLIILLIGIPLLILLAISMLVYLVIAIIKASNDELFRYPLTIRFLK